MQNIYESGEDYLETILKVRQKKGSVRSIDIAEEKKYSKSSVSRAVNLLKKNGYITIDKNGIIDFTELGRNKVENIYERHRFLTETLVKLGIDRETAEADSCRIEHVISEETFSALKNHFKNL
ncbi:MAG TPA: metal-dependent transcriptional regulator [Clostridia bacterium]|jgi:Mn-dependent DtxR family transcriptional regulator|nr:metal-dependent transcriptional regulator [Clostridia bacterium]